MHICNFMHACLYVYRALQLLAKDGWQRHRARQALVLHKLQLIPLDEQRSKLSKATILKHLADESSKLNKAIKAKPKEAPATENN